MAERNAVTELVGDAIKELFNSAERLAELHATLSSTRGGHFRLKLLQAMEAPLSESIVERMRVEAGVQEYRRHVNKLMAWGLVEQQPGSEAEEYRRTRMGEQAVNCLRELERSVGPQAAEALYAASLGPNSIKFFLRIYGTNKEVDWEHLDIRYTPAEIGRLSLFLPRSVEGISALDKLDEAGLLGYKEDNMIHLNAVRARAFYRYLSCLRQILASRSQA